MKFYTGTHTPGWIDRVSIPWFLSVNRIRTRRQIFTVTADWILDSGGFTEIMNHGRYTIPEAEYVRIIKLFNPRIAFCQDWMCESAILKRSGLSIPLHQVLTLKSYFSMQSKIHKVAPVLQGWNPEEYVEHAEMYAFAGADMSQLFGVGTICSRNGNPQEIRIILRGIKKAFPRIRLHGFGVKTEAVPVVMGILESADSMAWSARGRRSKLCSWCESESCANCMEYALLWRKKVLLGAGLYEQAYWRGKDKLPVAQSGNANSKIPKEKRTATNKTRIEG